MIDKIDYNAVYHIIQSNLELVQFVTDAGGDFGKISTDYLLDNAGNKDLFVKSQQMVQKLNQSGLTNDVIAIVMYYRYRRSITG